MPFNGSGSFTRVYNWTNDANASVPITASRFDTEDGGFATGLSNCITKDGQQTITQNIPFNNKQIKGLGAGTLATDAAQVQQVSKGGSNYVVAGGTANAIILSMSPVNAALTDGQRVYFQATALNTGATTLAVDGLGSLPPIITHSLAALVGGEIIIGGYYEAIWSALASSWILSGSSLPQLNIAGNAATATKLATARTIAVTGDLAYTSPSFDGSINVTAASTLATVNSNVGSFTNANVTVNAKGLITAASNGVSGLVLGSPVATTSGTGFNFNSFPVAVKQIDLYFSNIALSTSGVLIIQLGTAGGLVSSGYLGVATFNATGGGVGGAQYTAGFGTVVSTSASVFAHGMITFRHTGNNIWIASGAFYSNGNDTAIVAGTVTLGGALTQLQFTTVAGTATFTAGQASIAYQ